MGSLSASLLARRTHVLIAPVQAYIHGRIHAYCHSGASMADLAPEAHMDPPSLVARYTTVTAAPTDTRWWESEEVPHCTISYGVCNLGISRLVQQSIAARFADHPGLVPLGPVLTKEFAVPWPSSQCAVPNRGFNIHRR